MTITKQKKEGIINDLRENIEAAKNTIFVNFHGETVEKTRVLRKELRKMSAVYKVARKTLIKKALEEREFQGDFPEFKGEMALIFTKDDNAPAVLKFILKEASKEKFQVLGGVFANEYKDGDFAAMLSKIPLKEVLYYQLLNVLNSPLRRLVVSLSGGMLNFIRVLEQIS